MWMDAWSQSKQSLQASVYAEMNQVFNMPVVMTDVNKNVFITCIVICNFFPSEFMKIDVCKRANCDLQTVV